MAASIYAHFFEKQHSDFLLLYFLSPSCMLSVQLSIMPPPLPYIPKNETLAWNFRYKWKITRFVTAVKWGKRQSVVIRWIISGRSPNQTLGSSTDWVNSLSRLTSISLYRLWANRESRASVGYDTGKSHFPFGVTERRAFPPSQLLIPSCPQNHD